MESKDVVDPTSCSVGENPSENPSVELPQLVKTNEDEEGNNDSGTGLSRNQLVDKMGSALAKASTFAEKKADSGFAYCCEVLLSLILKIFLLEQETFTTEEATDKVKEYLDGNLRLECTPDSRLPDFELGPGASYPAWNKRTRGRIPCFPCYPLCCLPCFCQTRRRAKSEPRFCRCCRTCLNCDLSYDHVISEADNASTSCKRATCSCVFGLCCNYAVVWDFYLESNRSRLLSLFNGIMCILLLVATVSPLRGEYESSVSCRDSFGFTPKIIHHGCGLQGIPGFQTSKYNCSGVDVARLSQSPNEFCNGSPDLSIMSFVASTNVDRNVADYMKGSLTEREVYANGVPNCFPFKDTSGSNIFNARLLFVDNAEPSIVNIGLKSFRVFITIIYRPLLLAMANSRMNRGYGWGGVGWIAATINNIATLNFRTHDIMYCGTSLAVNGDLSGLQLGGEFGNQNSTNFVKADGFKLNGDPIESISPETSERVSSRLKQYDEAANWQLFWEYPIPVNEEDTLADRFTWDVKTSMIYACLCWYGGKWDDMTCDRDVFPWLNVHLAECDEEITTCTFPSSFDVDLAKLDRVHLNDFIGDITNVTKTKYKCPYGKSKVERALLANNFAPSFMPYERFGKVYNVSGWVGHGVPLTFSGESKLLRSTFSTFSILSGITFPITFDVSVADTRVKIPTKTIAFEAPKTISELYMSAYRPKYSYTINGGGFFWLINWINYVGLYVELVLLFWLAFKFVTRKCFTDDDRSALFRSRCYQIMPSFCKKRVNHSFRRRTMEKNNKKNDDVINEDESFVASNKNIKFRIPTRLVSSLTLSVIMLVGSTWKLSRLWASMEEAALEMENSYQTFVKESASPWVEIFSDNVDSMLTASAALAHGPDYKSWIDSTIQTYFSDNGKAVPNIGRSVFTLLNQSFIGFLNNTYNITEEIFADELAKSLNANVKQCLLEVTEMRSNTIYDVAETTLIESARALPSIASSLIGSRTSSNADGNLNVSTPFKNLTTTDLMTISTAERTALFEHVIDQVASLAVDHANSEYGQLTQSCEAMLSSATEKLALCILGKTLRNLGVNAASGQDTVMAMLPGMQSFVNNGYPKMSSNLPAEICDSIKDRMQSITTRQLMPLLLNKDQILVGALTNLVTLPETKKLIQMIPGIDTQAFVDSLVTKSGHTSAVRGESAIAFQENSTYEGISTGQGSRRELGEFLKIVNRMYGWFLDMSTLARDKDEVSGGLELIDWTITKSLRALVTAARGGQACTVIACVCLLIQIALFYVSVHTKGESMHRAIRKFFDPVSGSYASAIVTGKGTKRMTLANVFEIISRHPKPSEVRTLMELSRWTDSDYDIDLKDKVVESAVAKNSVFSTTKDANHERLKTSQLKKKLQEKAKLARSLDAQALRTHMVLCLQYRNLLNAPSFLGTFVYTNMFAFIIYFAIFFTIIVLPIQELFWIALWSYREVWVPLTALLIVKNVTNVLLARHLEMASGQYSGIAHPRWIGLFDIFKTILSCVVGWAPALVRIVASTGATLIYLPRLDVQLPGGSLDGSHLKYQGILETWRLQLEYRSVSCLAEELNMMDRSRDTKQNHGDSELESLAVSKESSSTHSEGFISRTLNPARKSALKRAGVRVSA